MLWLSHVAPPPTHPTRIWGLLGAILGKYRHPAEEQRACVHGVTHTEVCPSHSDSAHRSTAHMHTCIRVHACPAQPTQGLSLVQQDNARLLLSQQRDGRNRSEFSQGC